MDMNDVKWSDIKNADLVAFSYVLGLSGHVERVTVFERT